MANWGNLTARGNVEDRRSFAPAIGGLSITGIALMLLFNYLAGGDVTDVLNQIQTVPTENRQIVDNSQYAGEDEYELFASKVLGSNNQMWATIFKQVNQTYVPPRLVLFRTATQSSCGTATSRVGPHYCPLDRTVYLDETFFDELTNRLGAKGGDVAEAYVISHEVGHHAQNAFGTLEKVYSSQGSNSETELSIKTELQADCFAGMWAHSIQDAQVFEAGEISEAMDAAAAVGDDRIQERVTGYVNPESWTHGSSQERVRWFNKGYESGDLGACNTFE
jgi:uncharacterized protein